MARMKKLRVEHIDELSCGEDNDPRRRYNYTIHHDDCQVWLPVAGIHNLFTDKKTLPESGVFVLWFYSLGMRGPSGKLRSGFTATREAEGRPYGPEDLVYEVARYHVDFSTCDVVEVE